jgi:hypothetical protein
MKNSRTHKREPEIMVPKLSLDRRNRKVSARPKTGDEENPSASAKIRGGGGLSQRTNERYHKNTTTLPRSKEMIFRVKFKRDYNSSTEVTALPPSFDYWRSKTSSWLTLLNVKNAK